MPNQTVELDEREGAREAAYKQSKQSPVPTIKGIQQECWQIAEDHGFHDVGSTFGDKLMLIVSEAAEALEDFRAGKLPDQVWYEGTDAPLKPCGIPSELADIIIRVFDLAEMYSIDLQAITLEKMAYNRSRPYLHGKTL